MALPESPPDLRRAQRAAELRAASFAAPPRNPPRRRRAAVAAIAAVALLALPLAVWTFGWQPEPPPAPVARGAAFPWDRVPAPTGTATATADIAGSAPVGVVPVAGADAPSCAGEACDGAARRRAAEATEAATAAAAAASLRPDLVGAFGAVSDWTGWWGLQTDGATAAGAPLAVFPAVAGPPPAPSRATTDDGRSE